MKIFLRCFVRMLQILPRSAAIAVGSVIGWFVWALSFKRVNHLERRCVMALGVGVTSARAIVRASFINMARSLTEFFNIKSRDDALKLVEFEGEEHLRGAVEAGKGVILMTAHLGNWELGAAAVVASGYKLNAVYTPQRNRWGEEDEFHRQRERACGMGLIKSEGQALKDVFRVLKRGEVLVILQDLDARGDGMLMDFMGLPASVHMGIYKLSRKFDCPVVPCRIVSDGGFHKVKFFAPLHFDENMEKSLMICNNVIDEWVSDYPEQWMWILDRWKYAAEKCG